ncbi:DNA polymerase III subunit alpha [Sphingobacterium sp. SRCM116780]|uniref:DNA polymerase III subunit alpha n=1 Tax=Sphingobacterium sp. SRCM116780 TaxID=2907623 RepID=UPI001F39C05F|nr:DNA polymerase III subunit alpha [Sphingobacterium sp. SRCM116780]UIR56588.1 DNA polymerase III subunit alpha [Sphingobacterium sp. SRCM116780]
MFLNCKTWFSFHYGTYSTKELIAHAVELEVKVLGLTNINSTADCWDFVMKCQEVQIKPIIGVEVRNENQFCYVLLAKNRQGLLAIHKFLSFHKQLKIPFPERPNFCLDHVWVIYRLGTHPQIEKLSEQELIGVDIADLNKLEWQESIDQHKYIMLHPVTYQNKTYFDLHRILRAIAKNTLLSKLTKEDLAGTNEYLLKEEDLAAAFTRFPIIITKTMQVVESCSVEMEFHSDKNRKCFTDSIEEDHTLLRKLAFEGAIMRYGADHQEAFERVEKELNMIDKQGFNAYFLIVWDMLHYAHEHNFYHVGRGSGANSIIAYCLRITDVDPIELNLYFERFLNPNRSSPPDFDIDFSWQDRDTIFAYIFEKYGQEHVALLGMYNTFQRRAIIRELGKVFGLPKEEIDILAHKREWSAEDKIQRWIKRYGALLVNFPTHVSIHAGGVLISEQPLHEYMATELPPKGLLTAHLDMFEADRIGLFKFDILSQRGLGHIKDALALIEKNQGKQLDIHQVEHFFLDPILAEKIRKADTIGCFYIESPAMRQLLGKLKCSDYLTLVAASSIIRPGVAQSGMMKQYIERFHNRDKIVYLHPKMEELLEETYGVMVYQEDVIKVAHHFGGISLDEADILRRAMSGKYRSENKFEILKQKFFTNCRSFGYEDQVTAEVWRQMESFGGYSFAKGHSASFAVESYQSLFLKTYYPKEFYVAVINNFGGFYRTEFYFHELRRHGGDIQLPCLNHSDYLTNIKGNRVYVGLGHVQGLEEQLSQRIVSERALHGSYQDLNDVLTRIHPAPEQLNLLIRIGALRFTGMDKKSLLWKANFSTKKNFQEVPNLLFAQEEVHFELPQFETNRLEDLKDELDLLGFVTGDFYELLDDKYLKGTVKTVDFPDLIGQHIKIIGRLVTTKESRTIKKERMCFGTFLDVDGDWLDTVHFPLVLKQYPFLGAGFYELHGQVTADFDICSMNVSVMRKLGYRLEK